MKVGSFKKDAINISEFAVVDLFCGIGGLSYGFIKEGFDVVAGIDIDSTCKYPYEKNIGAKFYSEDLNIISSDFVKNLFPKNRKKILIGCAPCQAFSTYSHRYKENDKWKLLYTFSRIIKDIEPEIISMENVPHLKTYKKGKILDDFKSVLKGLHYTVTEKIVDASEYGVPQNRKRFILFATKDKEIQIIEPTHKNRKITVKKAIGHLPPIRDGETHAKDPLHTARELSPLNKKRIRATPEGGTWKDWPKELMLECHKKESGKSFKAVYGRMRWDLVAPTMTTQCTGLGNGRFGHPEQDRAISIREAAIFQSFPKSFTIYNPKDTIIKSELIQHIGNAVPAELGRVVAKSIKKHLIQ